MKEIDDISKELSILRSNFVSIDEKINLLPIEDDKKALITIYYEMRRHRFELERKLKEIQKKYQIISSST